MPEIRRPSSRGKVLVIGIDGGTFSVIDPLIAQGRLPNLAQIRETGSEGALRSVLPPHSAPAWATFLTGWNPGRHGILDFWERDLAAYDCPPARLITSDAFAGRTFLDHVGACGLRVGAVTVPVTYPAWPINGFMLSGYLLSPGMDRRAAYPLDLGDRFGDQLVFPEAYRQGARLSEIARAGPEMIQRRGQVAAEMLQEVDCDLLAVVLAPTDKAQHSFWRYHSRNICAESSEDFGEVVNRHYEVCDRVLGDLWDQMGRELTNVVVVSDHGAGPSASRCFQTHYALLEQGLLCARSRRARRGRRQPPIGLLPQRRTGARYHLRRWVRRLTPRPAWNAIRAYYHGISQIDWRRTVCYRVPMQAPTEGIMINVRGRQPQGIVDPGREYSDMQARVMDIMRQAKDPDTGQAIVEECYRREDVYRGPMLGRMPDVVLVLNPAYKGDRRLDSGMVSPTPRGFLEQFQGQHRMDGVIMGAGPQIRQGGSIRQACLEDVAPSLLHLMGVPIPEEMDGRVLSEALSEESEANALARAPSIEPAPICIATRYSAEEQSEIAERLAALGYLE